MEILEIVGPKEASKRAKSKKRVEKEEELLRLRAHNKELLCEVKRLKREKKKLENEAAFWRHKNNRPANEVN